MIIATGRLIIFLLFFSLKISYSQPREKLNQFNIKVGVPDFRNVKFPNANFTSRLDFYYFNVNYTRKVNLTEKVNMGPSFSYSQSVIKTFFDIKDKSNTLAESDQTSLGVGINLNYKINFKNKIDRIEVGFEYSYLFLQENRFSYGSSTLSPDNNLSSQSISVTVKPKTTKSVASMIINFVKVRRKINYCIGLNPELIFPEKYQVLLISTESSSLGGKKGSKIIVDNSLRLNFIFGIQF